MYRMKKIILFILLVAILVSGTCVNQAEKTSNDNEKQATESKPKGMHVFYASHSLMWDMPPVLTEAAEAYGIEGHTVLGIQRLGVSRTSQHWNLPDNQNQAKQALKAGNVDAFVMSPIGMPDPGIDNFVKLGLEHNPNAKFYIQVSWPGMGLLDNNDMESMMGGGTRGGRGGNTNTPPANTPTNEPGAMAPSSRNVTFSFAAFGGAPGGRGNMRGGFGGGMFGGNQDYNKTPEEIAEINVRNNKSAEEQAKKINEEVGKTVVYLIPTAQAHNALRVMIYNKEMPGMTDQGEVFRDFIGHPTAPVVALNTYLHFAVLYQRSPVGLPQPTILKNPPAGLRAGWKDEWKDAKLNTKLQELAWEIVSNYPPSGVKAPVK
jgi:hypothetical protein